MKHETLIYGLGTLIVIAGALMKILHLPYANMTLVFGLIGTIVFQTWHVSMLKKKIKELESR